MVHSSKDNRIRLLSPWPNNFYASLSICRKQGAEPLTFRMARRTIKNEFRMKSILESARAEMEMDLKNEELAMSPTAKQMWISFAMKIGSIWTGTITAYQITEEPLARLITASECSMQPYFNMAFEVPKLYVGMKNAKLEVDYPYFGISFRSNGSGGQDVLITPDPKKVRVILSVSENTEVYPGAFISSVVLSSGNINLAEPMSRNYCRMLVKPSGDSSV